MTAHLLSIERTRLSNEGESSPRLDVLEGEGDREGRATSLSRREHQGDGLTKGLGLRTRRRELRCKRRLSEGDTKLSVVSLFVAPRGR